MARTRVAKVLSALLVAHAISCASTPTSSSRTAAEIPESALEVHLGVRSLDDDDWELVENQGTLGLGFHHEGAESIVGYEVAFFVSGDEADDVDIGGTDVDLRATTTELSFGLRKSFRRDQRLQPYVGGGLSLLRAELESESSTSTVDEDSGSGGIYLHGGVDLLLGPSLSLGLDLRLRGGEEVDFLGDDRSTDYGQLALVLGARF